MAYGTVSELLGSSADGVVTLEVGVEGDANAALEPARGLPGVTEVVPDEDQPGILLVRSPNDVRNELVAELTRRNLHISQLLRRRPGLEAVYRRYIQECEDRYASRRDRAV
jgi:hypothetical protein